MRCFATCTISAIPSPLLPFQKPSPINRAYFWLHCSSPQPAGPRALPPTTAPSACCGCSLPHPPAAATRHRRDGSRRTCPHAIDTHLACPQPCPPAPSSALPAGQCHGASRACSAPAAQRWNVCFPPRRPGETGRRGIIEYISPEPIQPQALYEQCLLTELIFAK